MMRRAFVFGCVIVTVMMASGGFTAASQVATEVVTPEEYFGFRPGADRKLLDYDQLISYLELVDGASSRVLIREAGHSAYGRPLMTIFISSPNNLGRLERLEEINRQLALDSEIPEDELEEIIDRVRARIRPLDSMPTGVFESLNPRRIGVVETFFHDMDAGWTRFVLDQIGIPHRVLRPGDFGPSDLSEGFDVILFPREESKISDRSR